MSDTLSYASFDLSYLDRSKQLALPPDEQHGTRNDNGEITEILGGRGFVWGRFLSPRECTHFIEQAETLGMQHVSSQQGTKREYRNNERVVAFSEALAKLWFERLKPVLPQITVDDNNLSHYGIGREGVWEFCGINDAFRLCRYDPGGHFSPHMDGEYRISDSERSLKTIMIYLNGDFDGGATNFLSPNISSNAMRAEPEDILEVVVPSEGLAVVFDHFIMHEGAALKTNHKYIMRTEAVYRRIADVELNISPKVREARQLLAKAAEAERNRQYDEATALYRRAFKLDPSLEKFSTVY